MKRQQVRKLILIVSLLLFPITIYYFSPYLIIWGATEGIITGSFIMFITLTLFGILFGRVFCAYLCPMGGLQSCLSGVNQKSPKVGKRKYIKYVIWIIWIGAIIIWNLYYRSRQLYHLLYGTWYCSGSVSTTWEKGILSLFLLGGAIYGTWRKNQSTSSSAGITY